MLRINFYSLESLRAMDTGFLQRDFHNVAWFKSIHYLSSFVILFLFFAESQLCEPIFGFIIILLQWFSLAYLIATYRTNCQIAFLSWFAMQLSAISFLFPDDVWNNQSVQFTKRLKKCCFFFWKIVSTVWTGSTSLLLFAESVLELARQCCVSQVL